MLLWYGMMQDINRFKECYECGEGIRNDIGLCRTCQVLAIYEAETYSRLQREMLMPRRSRLPRGFQEDIRAELSAYKELDSLDEC